MNKFYIFLRFLIAWRTQKLGKLEVNVFKFVRGSWCVTNDGEEFTIWRKDWCPDSWIEKFHFWEEWFGLLLIFGYKIFDVAKTFLLNEIGSHIKTIVKSSLKFLLFGKVLIFKQEFDKTVDHVINDGLVDIDLTFLKFELLRKGHI